VVIWDNWAAAKAPQIVYFTTERWLALVSLVSQALVSQIESACPLKSGWTVSVASANGTPQESADPLR